MPNDRRDHDLDAREGRIEAREAAQANRAEREEELLADADKRDDRANERDAAANRRDMTANIERFLPSATADSDDLQAQNAAAQDRTDSRGRPNRIQGRPLPACRRRDNTTFTSEP